MGLAVIDGPNPAHPSSDETTLVTMFSGANGPLNGDAADCGESVAIRLAVKVIGDEFVAGAARLKVRTSGVDSALVTRNAFGNCGVETAVAGSSCGRENADIADGVLRDDALGALGALVPFFGDDAVDVLPVVGAESPSADVGDSGVDAFSEEVLSGCVDGVDAAGFFSSVDDAAEESAALVEADDVALESVGSANATPGELAAAQPTPRATANAPTRPTYRT